MIQLVLSPDVKNILIIETSLSILSGHQTGKISICKLCSTAVFQCSTVTSFSSTRRLVPNGYSLAGIMHVLHRLPRFRYCCPAKILGRHCSHPCYAWWSFERRGKGVACCCRDHILGDGTLGMTSKTTADKHDWQKESWESFIHSRMNEWKKHWLNEWKMKEWVSQSHDWVEGTDDGLHIFEQNWALYIQSMQTHPPKAVQP